MKQAENYNSIAKFLHWSIAILIILNYIIGLTLNKNNWYPLHKQIGLSILTLAILRIIWRLTSSYPAKLDKISALENRLAHIGQGFLYLLMLLLPLSGIIMTQVYGSSLSLFGLSSLPIFISPVSPTIQQFISQAHLYLAHAIIILAFAHASVALIHHYIYKNRLLRRMLPFNR